MQKRSEEERRSIWPCLNVATWRRERSDRVVQQICYPVLGTTLSQEFSGRLHNFVGTTLNQEYRKIDIRQLVCPVQDHCVNGKVHRRIKTANERHRAIPEILAEKQYKLFFDAIKSKKSKDGKLLLKKHNIPAAENQAK